MLDVDTLGNGSDLAPIGTPSFNGTGGLDFDAADGLTLGTGITTGDFRLELDLVFDNVIGYRKIIDFQSQTTDEGLYIGQSSDLEFYDGFGNSGVTLLSGVSYTLGVQKLAGVTRIDLDGLPQFSFLQAEPTTSNTNTLTFFVDDVTTSGEDLIGTVSAIRILNVTAVPEPNAFALFILIFGAAFAIRRRKVEQSRALEYLSRR